jgi:hypothetical protein
MQVCVPYTRRSGVVQDWPAILRQQDGLLTLVESSEVPDQIVFRVEDNFSRKNWEIAFIRAPSTELETKVIPVQLSNYCPWANLGRVMEALVYDEICFQWPEGTQGSSLNFWQRLGLHRVGDHFYKIARGVARKRYAPTELETVEGLQTAALANVAVLAPDLYVQEQDGRWTAVGRFTIDSEETDFEIYLDDPSEAAHAMVGNQQALESIRQRLEAGARNKVELARQDRARIEAESATQLAADEKFRALCEEYSDLEITLEDSLAAGNCRPGTEGFLDREFPGKSSVTVKVLMHFLSVYGVRRVLEHKLLPLAKNETPNS